MKDRTLKLIGVPLVGPPSRYSPHQHSRHREFAELPDVDDVREALRQMGNNPLPKTHKEYDRYTRGLEGQK